MKFRSIFALCLALALVFCGCGKADEYPGGTVTPAPVQAQTPTQATEPSQEETQPQEETLPQKQISLGQVLSGNYENEYLGYGFTLGEGWTFQTAEALQDITQFTIEMMEGTDLESYAASSTQIIDFQAENPAYLAGMNVVYNRLSTEEQIVSAMMTEMDFLEGVISMQDSVVEAYANAGITMESMEIVTITFLGKERPAILSKAIIKDVNYYILQFYEINLGGNYNAVVTLSSFEDNITEQLLDRFYPLG